MPDAASLKTVFIAGRFTPDSLEGSYARAFTKLGLKVVTWDVPAAVRRFTRLGKIGAYLNDFCLIEPWLVKSNRDFLYAVIDSRPDIVAVVASHRIMAGALAQIKAALPACQLILIWPDTLLHCPSHTIQSIPVFDLIATYSKLSVEPFRRLGAQRAEWVPLGYDPELHPPDASAAADARFAGDYDVSFVGNHSAERETTVLHLVERGFRVAVWGAPGGWARAQDKQAVRRYFKGGPLFAKDLSAAVKAAPVSLNPIATSNYPAANMRFFEIPGSGGVPVSVRCPEMEGEFPDREGCFYYDGLRNMAEVLRAALDDKGCRERVRRNAHDRVMASHTYAHRAAQILALLSAADSRAMKAS